LEIKIRRVLNLKFLNFVYLTLGGSVQGRRGRGGATPRGVGSFKGRGRGGISGLL